MKRLAAITALALSVSIGTTVHAQVNGQQSGTNHGAVVSAAAHSGCVAPHLNNPTVVNQGGCVSLVAQGQTIGTSAAMPGFFPSGQP